MIILTISNGSGMTISLETNLVELEVQHTDARNLSLILPNVIVSLYDLQTGVSKNFRDGRSVT